MHSITCVEKLAGMYSLHSQTKFRQRKITRQGKMKDRITHFRQTPDFTPAPPSEDASHQIS